jgi:glycosyltransferase involved in cell wall biosynthesis
MNVLLIPSSFPTKRQPWPGNYIYEYARSLALQHNVTVVYPQQLGAPGIGDEPFYSEEWLEPRIRFINYSYSHLPKSWMLSYFGAFRKIRKRIHEEWKIDIIFSHVVLPAGLAALALSRLFRVPVILTEHWGPAEDWLKDLSLPPKVMRAIIENTYRRVDYLTAVSESLANEIEAVFGASTNGKIDYPIDCDVFHPNATQTAVSAARVLCVTRGKFDPRKGISNLLKAWKVVSQRAGQVVHLDIIGPDIEELEPQIEAMGIGKTCSLLPWRPAVELAPLMQRSTLLVIPSSYETFGRSGAEALACGVPVVATDCGGPKEYVADGTGLLVPIEDHQALADGITYGLTRSRFLPPEELASRIRQRFGYQAISDRFTEVATSLLANGKK